MLQIEQVVLVLVLVIYPQFLAEVLLIDFVSDFLQANGAPCYNNYWTATTH